MLRLPHLEMAGLLDAIKRNVVGSRQCTVADMTLSYVVFRPGLDTPDLAFYDEDGTIYLPMDLVQSDEQVADLLAFHEHLEIQHKQAGRSHAYAHRRALLEELLAAKQVCSAPAFQHYLDWRIGMYPAWKVPNPGEVVAQLALLLAADRLRKGDLLQVIKERRL